MLTSLIKMTDNISQVIDNNDIIVKKYIGGVLKSMLAIEANKKSMLSSLIL